MIEETGPLPERKGGGGERWGLSWNIPGGGKLKIAGVEEKRANIINMNTPTSLKGEGGHSKPPP